MALSQILMKNIQTTGRWIVPEMEVICMNIISQMGGQIKSFANIFHAFRISLKIP